MGLVNGKRLLFKVNTKQRFEGSIRICIKDNNRLVINKCIERKVKELNPLKFNKVVGIDKNLNNLFDTSNGTTYGKNFSDLNNSYTEVLFEKNKKRQFYHQLLKNDKISLEKKNNIIKFNLGKKKYDRLKNKEMEEIRKFVNKNINDMLSLEQICELVLENLNFTTKNKKYIKLLNRRLSGWIKGYLDERLEYKCREKDIKYTKVNAAYTSQTCGCCGLLGKRNADKFYCVHNNCYGSKGVDAGQNAARVILNRNSDKDISLTTYPSQVKKLLELRLLEMKSANGFHTEPTKTIG